MSNEAPTPHTVSERADAERSEARRRSQEQTRPEPMGALPRRREIHAGAAYRRARERSRMQS